MTRTTTKDRRRRRSRGAENGDGDGSGRRGTAEGSGRRGTGERGRRRRADDGSGERGVEDEARGRITGESGEDERLGRDEPHGSDDDDRDDGGSGGGVFAELKNVAADAALAVLAPVAKKAATGAAKYAVKKGPELLEDTVKPMLEDAGGVKGLVGQAMSSDGPAGGLLSKLTPGGDADDDGGDGKGGGAGDGTGKGRRMPVQQAVDVAAPIDVVYDQWTQFEDYPKFMHRVQRVEQRDESHVAFHAKVWGINRMWEAEIVEQRPDERIAFKSVNGVQLTGVVTFHDMAERLTRIELNIDVDPDGPVEKIARGTRMVKRAARGDLKRFKAYVEMHEDETGAWRGEIQDGDVVSEPGDEHDDDEARYEEEEDEQAEASYDDEPPEDEPEASYDEEEDEGEDEEEDEDDQPAPARKRSRSTASRSKSTSKRSRSNGGDPGQSKPKARAKSSSSRSRGSSKSGSSSSSRKRSSSASAAKKRGSKR